MSKKVFKVLSYIEDMFCVGMIVIGITLITLNLTPNMPLYGLVMKKVKKEAPYGTSCRKIILLFYHKSFSKERSFYEKKY